MSLVANEKGGSFETLRIINNKANVQTTLEKRLLKDLQTYSAAVKTFYTNAVPSLLAEDVQLLKVYPKDDLDQIPDEWTLTANALDREENHRLTIKRAETHNILGLVQQISKFFKEINKKIHLYGSDFGANAAYHITPPVAFNPLVIHNEVAATVHVAFSIDTNGRASFKCSQAFLDQFYIQFDPNFAKLIDIPTYLWSGTTTNNARVSEGSIYDLGAGPQVATLYRTTPVFDRFNFTIHSTTPGGRGLEFVSNRSIFLADQRQTLVVEMSMPFSRTVLSEDGKHVEKYRLCEFPIDNYIKTKGTARSRNGQVLANVETTDTLQGGLTDFTRGFPETHIVHFLAGDLYTVNTRIYIVYKNFTGVKVEKAFELGDGFYDLEILFIKKEKNGRGKQRVPQRS
jgi:hypothetical protein